VFMCLIQDSKLSHACLAPQGRAKRISCRNCPATRPKPPTIKNCELVETPSKAAQLPSWQIMIVQQPAHSLLMPVPSMADTANTLP
jgi:hypothetical protein